MSSPSTTVQLKGRNLHSSPNAEALREKMGDDSFEESKRRDLQTEAIYT